MPGWMQPYRVEAPRSSLGRRVFTTALVIAVFVILVAHGFAGWAGSGWMGARVLTSERSTIPDAAVVEIGEDQLTLSPAAGADRDIATPGQVGFVIDDGYLELGTVVTVRETEVVREFAVVDGNEPSIGSFGDVDPTAMPFAHAILDIGLRPVTFESDVGTLEAWQADGSDTWVIHVHDHRAEVTQPLRMMSVLAIDGFSQLAITYRNDPDQPPGPNPRFTYGVDERNDLAAAIAYARQEGARTVILAGYGSGGAVVIAELYRDPDVAGAILDSPVLDARSAVRHEAAGDDAYPLASLSSVAAVSEVFASMRYGVSWDTVDYLARIEQLAVPVTVIHAVDDPVDPIAASRTMAAQRPDLVTLVEIEGAGLDLAWNADPARYERAVFDFVDSATG
jgi:pimeloyl-ACP methyl ester carboxylesterase